MNQWPQVHCLSNFCLKSWPHPWTRFWSFFKVSLSSPMEQTSCPYTIYIQSFMLLSQVSTNLWAQRNLSILTEYSEVLLSHCHAVQLQLWEDCYMEEIIVECLMGLFSRPLILSLTPSLWLSLFICIFNFSKLSPPVLTLILPLSRLYLSRSPLSPLPNWLLWQEQCSHQAFLMLRHSAAAVSSFPLSPLWLCHLLLSPGVIGLPPTHPLEVASHRDYGLNPNDL